MTTVPTSTDDALVGVRWGLGDAVVGWVVAYGCAAVFGVVILQASGYLDRPDDIPLTVIALQYPPLWIGFVGVPIWAATVKGGGWIHDFRVHVRWIDLPIGIVAGLVTQFVIAPLVSWPFLELTGHDFSDLGDVARDLGDKATDPLGVFLLFALVVGLAPFAEELFFRGLTMRSLEKSYGTVVAVIGSSVFFGATHFQPLLFPALTVTGLVFALLVVRTGRLGTSIVAHMVFNGATAVGLVWGHG